MDCLVGWREVGSAVGTMIAEEGQLDGRTVKGTDELFAEGVMVRNLAGGEVVDGNMEINTGGLWLFTRGKIFDPLDEESILGACVEGAVWVFFDGKGEAEVTILDVGIICSWRCNVVSQEDTKPAEDTYFEWKYIAMNTTII